MDGNSMELTSIQWHSSDAITQQLAGQTPHPPHDQRLRPPGRNNCDATKGLGSDASKRCTPACLRYFHCSGAHNIRVRMRTTAELNVVSMPKDVHLLLWEFAREATGAILSGGDVVKMNDSDLGEAKRSRCRAL
jgi:hypothetical protein